MIEPGQVWILKWTSADAVYLVLEVDPGDSRNAVVKVFDLSTGSINKFWKDSYKVFAMENGERIA